MEHHSSRESSLTLILPRGYGLTSGNLSVNSSIKFPIYLCCPALDETKAAQENNPSGSFCGRRKRNKGGSGDRGPNNSGGGQQAVRVSIGCDVRGNHLFRRRCLPEMLAFQIKIPAHLFDFGKAGAG